MILCLLYRRRLSALVDADLDLGPALQRHVQVCAGCHQFYEQELSLARNLARSAGQERVAPPAFLQARIMAAVDRSDRPSHARPPWRRLAWAAGLAAAFTLVFRAVLGPVSPPKVLPTPDASAVIKELAVLEKSLPDKRELAQWSGTLDRPLDKELRSLYHDARNAGLVLVQNFLPDSQAQPPADEKGER